MKTYIFGILAVIASFGLNAQSLEKTDTWTISLNKKIILSTSNEDETANTKKIQRSALTKKAAFLDIKYTQGRVRTGWDRSIIFYDENDAELLSKNIKAGIKLSSKEMKKIATAGKKIKIYTIAVPADPKIAATVRVRRVHLCTLEL